MSPRTTPSCRGNGNRYVFPGKEGVNNERAGGTTYVLAYHTTLDDRRLVRAPVLREPKHDPKSLRKGQLRATHANAHHIGHYNTKLGIIFEKGSVESTHKVPTSHYHTKHCPIIFGLRKGQVNRHTRYRPAHQPLPHETLPPRSGRVTRWTNTPVRIFKDPAPTPIPPIPPHLSCVHSHERCEAWSAIRKCGAK